MSNDPRQKTFLKVVGDITKNLKDKGYDNIAVGTSGDEPMFAASVNLGVLQDKITEGAQQGYLQNEDEVRNFLRHAVQRLKRITVTKKDSYNKEDMYYQNYNGGGTLPLY